MTNLKEKIFPIAKLIYSEENRDELLSFWENILEESTEIDDLRNRSISLTALCLLIDSIDSNQMKDIVRLITNHKQKVIELLKPFVDRDLKTNSSKDEIIDELLSMDTAETGSSLLYHRLREAISMKLFEPENDVPTFKIKDGNNTHVAKILTDADEGMVLNNGVIGQWEVLMTQAITSMDDYTADTFDVISILWMNSAKTKNDVIHFSHEDVLRFRALQKQSGGTGSTSYRKRDRIEVMRRLAAIASIWISVTDDEDIAFVEQLDKNKDFIMSKYRRLFQIDNVTFAHDRGTNEAIGIYACDIKPTDLLAKYLYGTKKTTSFLSLKALRYNPVHQKYHKRLTRYLSWQWRIRSKKEDYEKPFNIGGEKGLINAIGLEINERRPIRTKESLENVLDKLAEDNVIGSWNYVEIDEDRIGTKGWFENYWTKLQIVINLPDELKKEFSGPVKEILDYNKITEFCKALHSNNSITEDAPLQLEFNMSMDEPEEIEVNPSTVKATRKKRSLSITKAAEEIGIAHTTLSRYEKGLIKKPNSKNDEKLRKWLTG